MIDHIYSTSSKVRGVSTVLRPNINTLYILLGHYQKPVQSCIWLYRCRVPSCDKLFNAYWCNLIRVVARLTERIMCCSIMLCDAKSLTCVSLVNTFWEMSLLRSRQLAITYIKSEPAIITEYTKGHSILQVIFLQHPGNVYDCIIV